MSHVAVLRLLVASTGLMMAGACRKEERYALWPPLQSAGDKEAYVTMSSSLCSNASVRFTSEQTETGIIEVLAVGDGATRVQQRVTSQTDESVADGKRSSEAGVLIGRDVLIERTGPRQWKRTLKGAPPAGEEETAAVADTSGPPVSEPEDYPKKPVALHETWPVSLNDDDVKLTGTCSIVNIEDIETIRYAVIDCIYTGSFGGRSVSSMTSREWISLKERHSLKNEVEAHFNMVAGGENIPCSIVMLSSGTGL